MAKYVNVNANPYGKTIGDCTVRSLSLGCGIPYEHVCEMLGKRCSEGYGLVGDVSLNDLIAFSKDTKLIKPVAFDKKFFDYVYRDEDYVAPEKWPTVRDFTERVNLGKYILLVRNQHIDMTGEYARELFKDTFHVMLSDCSKGEYYDNQNNDPGGMIVYGVFKILN